MHATLVVAICFFIGSCVAQSDQCSNFTVCSSCTLFPIQNGIGCGWCSCDGRCWTGTIQAPSHGQCRDGWYFGAGMCPDCTDIESCTECTETDGCGWCDSSNQCQSAQTSTCQLSFVCPCSDYEQCTDCRNDQNCLWCSSTNLCVDQTSGDCTMTHPGNCTCDLFKDCPTCSSQQPCGWCDKSSSCMPFNDNQSCLVSHTCSTTTKPEGGFSGGSFVGGMFLGLGVAALALGGYAGWRYYNRNEYSTLN